MAAYVFPAGNAIWSAEAIIAKMCRPGYMSPDDWRPITGCAIALAEAGGNPLALGRVVWKPGSVIHLSIDSLGMWQLESYWHTVTGPFPPDIGPITVAQCFDPFEAFEQVWKVINRGRTGWSYRWDDWSTAKSPDGIKPPAYDKYLSSALAGMKSYRAVMGLGAGVFGA